MGSKLIKKPFTLIIKHNGTTLKISAEVYDDI